MNSHPLIYRSIMTGMHVRFRKVGRGKYERFDGAIISWGKMLYKYEFVRSDRAKQTWMTTQNGFRVRVRP